MTLSHAPSDTEQTDTALTDPRQTCDRTMTQSWQSRYTGVTQPFVTCEWLGEEKNGLPVQLSRCDVLLIVHWVNFVISDEVVAPQEWIPNTQPMLQYKLCMLPPSHPLLVWHQFAGASWRCHGQISAGACYMLLYFKAIDPFFGLTGKPVVEVQSSYQTYIPGSLLMKCILMKENILCYDIVILGQVSLAMRGLCVAIANDTWVLMVLLLMSVFGVL